MCQEAQTRAQVFMTLRRLPWLPEHPRPSGSISCVGPAHAAIFVEPLDSPVASHTWSDHARPGGCQYALQYPVAFVPQRWQASGQPAVGY